MKHWKTAGEMALGFGAGLVASFSLLYMLTVGAHATAETIAQEPSIPHSTIDGVTFHAETYGDSTEPVMLVIHGAPGDHQRSLPSLQTLSDEFSVVYFDQGGARIPSRVNPKEIALGQNLMIVGGYNNDNWEDPSEWMEWIMAYKGWSQTEWDQFYRAWTQSDDALRTQMMADNRVYLFDWTACDCAADRLVLGDSPHQNASRRAHVEDMLSELETQLSELEDVTLIGHSKGGNLVLNYMQHNGRYVRNAVTIDAIWMDTAYMRVARAMPPILDDTGQPCYESASANIVNIYNSEDWVNSFAEGYHTGNVRNLMVDESEDPHSTKGWMASYTLHGMRELPR